MGIGSGDAGTFRQSESVSAEDMMFYIKRSLSEEFGVWKVSPPLFMLMFE